MERKKKHDPFTFEDKLARDADRIPGVREESGHLDAASTDPALHAKQDSRPEAEKLDAVLQERLNEDLARLEEDWARREEERIAEEDWVRREEQRLAEEDWVRREEQRITEEEWVRREEGQSPEEDEECRCPLCAMFPPEDDGTGFIGGIFDDEGNRVDPASIPTPGLCILCRRYDTDAWGEEVLCLLTRLEASVGDEEFTCSGFAPRFRGTLP